MLSIEEINLLRAQNEGIKKQNRQLQYVLKIAQERINQLKEELKNNNHENDTT